MHFSSLCMRWIVPFYCLCVFVQAQQSTPLYVPAMDSLLAEKQLRFPFGLASGDPKENQVVLWTRLWHPSAQSLEVNLQMALDSNFKHIIFTRPLLAQRQNFYNVKLLATDLMPGTTYYYRFCSEDACSPIGRTLTASTNTDSLSFAVASCSNYEWGYFNAYRLIAKEKNLQAVIHLGDYIYEYGVGKYGDEKLPRKHIPSYEIVTRADYESRYAQYRLDADLQEAHRMHPFITVWDDHEIANDAHLSGAQNHQAETEGPWEVRKEVAKKVYFSWLPIEEGTQGGVRRKFSFGNFAELFMLDGRLEGRSPQADSPEDSARFSSERSMLGKAQTQWLIDGLTQSTAHWKLVGNQVIFSSYRLPPKLEKTNPKSMDMWEGYPVERDFIADALQKSEITGLLVLTGDVHASFAFELRSNLDSAQTAFGAEWVTPSISSANLDEYIAGWKVSILENKLRDLELNPHAKYLDLKRHGYLRIDLNQEKAVGTWYYIKQLNKPTQKTYPPVRLEYPR